MEYGEDFVTDPGAMEEASVCYSILSACDKDDAPGAAFEAIHGLLAQAGVEGRYSLLAQYGRLRDVGPEEALYDMKPEGLVDGELGLLYLKETLLPFAHLHKAMAIYRHYLTASKDELIAMGRLTKAELKNSKLQAQKREEVVAHYHFAFPEEHKSYSEIKDIFESLCRYTTQELRTAFENTLPAERTEQLIIDSLRHCCELF